MTTFSHSGTHGDLIYSLNITKKLGGGDFYLRLNNMDEMARRTFGPNATAGDHAGEMTERQFHGLTDFMMSQDYIKSWNIWKGEHIDYALEDSGKEIVKQNGVRQQYVDQAISLNLTFDPNDTPKWISQVHKEAHKQGVKTLYYLRTESVLRGDNLQRLSDCISCEG
jgi:ribonucleotide reductase alpha subunit